MFLIPAIDLHNGHCVRLYQGDFNVETRYKSEPHELLLRYAQLGSSWLHIVDLDGAKGGTLANRAAILALTSQHTVRLQVGGGVRSPDVIEDFLSHGVERVVIGSAAVERPAEVRRWLQCFGPNHICLALDVRLDEAGEPLVWTRGWTQNTNTSLWQALNPFLESGLKHVLCTDITRDGALNGPNLNLYHYAIERHPQLAWQASGGVRNAPDLTALARIGVSATVCGKALLEERIPSEELQPFLPNASSPASTCATIKS